MSAENAASADQRTFLRTYEDWADWDRAFQIKAHSADIWALINPDQDDQPLEEPVTPTFSSYFRRIPAQRIKPELPRETRQSFRQTLPSVPILIPESHDPIERARSIKELTAEDRASYQCDREDYDLDHRQFVHQHQWIDKVKTWVLDTVANGLLATFCDPEQDLRNWYTNLKNSVGTPTTAQQNEALAKYHQILSAVPRAPKEFPN